MAIQAKANMMLRVAGRCKPKPVVPFCCEPDVEKSKHLAKCGVKAIYKFIARMGQDKAEVHFAGGLQEVLGAEIVVCGFNCRDWSNMAKYSSEMITYITHCLKLLAENLTKDLPEPAQGSTLPTLIGLIKYILRQRPPVVVNWASTPQVFQAIRNMLLRVCFLFRVLFHLEVLKTNKT